MASPTPAGNLSGLALRLVRDGLLAAGDAERLQTEANTRKIPLVTHLVASKKLNSAALAKAASEEFGVPLFDITAIDPDSAPIKQVDEKILRKHNVLPLYKRGNKLYVAVSDPTNLHALDEIKFNTGMVAEPILVDETKLALALDKLLDAADTTLTDLAGADDLENLDIGGDDDAKAKGPENEADVNDAPIVKFVNKLLLDATQGAARHRARAGGVEGRFLQALRRRHAREAARRAPLLLARIQTGRDRNGHPVVALHPAEGQGVTLTLDPVLLHSVCRLLQAAVKKSDWDMELKLPGAEAGEGAERAPRIIN